MNCGVKVQMSEISAGLQKDIDRIDEIWREGLGRFGGEFVAGDSFSAADAFYCPVAYRVTAYQLPMSDESLDYCQRLLGLSAMQEWDSAAIAETREEVSHEEEAMAAGKIIEDRRRLSS